jgi:hypothetical protein
MKNIIITLILLISVVSIFTFIGLYYFLNIADPSNQVNTMMRRNILKIPLLRSLLRLHQVGDARYEYTLEQSHALEVYLYYQEGVTLEKITLEKLPEKLNLITRRYFSMNIHDPIILRNISAKVTDADIKSILHTYDSESPIFTQTVPLHIFLLKYYLPHPSYAGLVINAHSLILFKQPITYVSEDESSPQAVEISTILHEFAHLLGAEHIDNSECILADTLENLNYYQKIKTRDSFCEEDLEAISQALR